MKSLMDSLILIVFTSPVGDGYVARQDSKSPFIFSSSFQSFLPFGVLSFHLEDSLAFAPHPPAVTH